MNLDALRYFIAVAEAGSMREAAESLHIAQSALSRQIQNLEREFGAVLFSRMPRGVELTEAGRVLLKRARDGLAAIALARDEISAQQGLQTGTIRIASIEPFAEQLLPDLIARFRQRHPGIGFDVRVGNTRRILGMLHEGVAEIGIAYNPPADPDIRVLVSLRQPLVALVSPGHELTNRGGSIRFSDLVGYPLAVAPARSPTRQVIDDAARRAGVRLEVAVESDSVPLRLGVAERGGAVAVLAELSGRAAVEQKRLVRLSFDGTFLEESEVQILAFKGRAQSRAHLIFERELFGSLKRLNLPVSEAVFG